MITFFTFSKEMSSLAAICNSYNVQGLLSAVVVVVVVRKTSGPSCSKGG